ncbi:hypothetical protein F0562_013122 [Nyssa sinensis]|uniref:Uncharacterized protein n=1 Tax=Nyssa sinensis TaxID=561372 RepID=A0A5J4ZZJ3_9ASTE|nr:hypothetical protein F0562_013122 [Nyssa sinensis]
MQLLINTLDQLRNENDLAVQLTNQTAVNSEVEELQQEVSGLQQQLQMAEEKIRNFEPDPSKMTSMEELESCEKHLENTLNCGMQNSFDHDFFHWIPDNGHNHAPIFDAAASSLPLRDVSSRVYDPLLHGTSSDVDHPQGGMGECHISNPRDGNFPAWHHTFTSTDLHPNHMASTLFSLVQVIILLPAQIILFSSSV